MHHVAEAGRGGLYRAAVVQFRDPQTNAVTQRQGGLPLSDLAGRRSALELKSRLGGKLRLVRHLDRSVPVRTQHSLEIDPVVAEHR